MRYSLISREADYKGGQSLVPEGAYRALGVFYGFMGFMGFRGFTWACWVCIYIYIYIYIDIGVYRVYQPGG